MKDEEWRVAAVSVIQNLSAAVAGLTNLQPELEDPPEMYPDSESYADANRCMIKAMEGFPGIDRSAVYGALVPLILAAADAGIDASQFIAIASYAARRTSE